MAERVGFEPTVPLRVHALSRRAPSSARSSLRPAALQAPQTESHGTAICWRRGRDSNPRVRFDPHYAISSRAHSTELCHLSAPSCQGCKPHPPGPLPGRPSGGAPGPIRTADLQLRRLLLCPSELRGHRNPQDHQGSANSHPQPRRCAPSASGLDAPRTAQRLASTERNGAPGPIRTADT